MDYIFTKKIEQKIVVKEVGLMNYTIKTVGTKMKHKDKKCFMCNKDFGLNEEIYLGITKGYKHNIHLCEECANKVKATLDYSNK